MPAFPPTRHSVVAALREGSEADRRVALARVAAAYWQPVYAYLRLQWRLSADEAEDETQEFFAHLVERALLERYDPSRARLRTYLRLCADGFAAHRREARGRRKRGGGVTHLALDSAIPRPSDGEVAAAERAVAELPSAEPDPETLFAHAWTRRLLELALADLRRACAGAGRARRWRVFAAHDLAEPAARPSYAALGASFGVPTTTVTNELAAARRELRRHLLGRLAELTASEAELRAEAELLLGGRR